MKQQSYVFFLIFKFNKTSGNMKQKKKIHLFGAAKSLMRYSTLKIVTQAVSKQKNIFG